MAIPEAERADFDRFRLILEPRGLVLIDFGKVRLTGQIEPNGQLSAFFYIYIVVRMTEGTFRFSLFIIQK